MKYPAIHELEERHGTDLGAKYKNRDSAHNLFTARLQLHASLAYHHFYSNVYVASTLKSMDIENLLQRECVFSAHELPPLIGCGTDCASVNVSDQNGMQGKFQAAILRLNWAWCYSHPLELA